MKPLLRIVVHVRTLLTCFFIIPLIQFSIAVDVEGYIRVKHGTVEGAAIHSIIDGHRLNVHKVDSRGKYQIELEYNHKYELIFALKGNISQKVVVETLVPDEVFHTNPQFQTLDLDVNLYPEIPGIKLSFVEEPIRKIYYNPLINEFSAEIFKDEKEMVEQIELANFHSQIVKKESEFLSKLSQYELAEMKREYERILEKAGRIAYEKPVFTAFNESEISSGIFRSENTLNIINELLGTIIIASEIDRVKIEQFDDFIIRGNSLLNKKKYTSARISYNRALSIYPDNEYALNQCKLINSLVEKQVEIEKYKYLIAYADNSFSELLYNEAAKQYRVALQFKPDEHYPKTQLEAIDKILEKECKDAEKSTCCIQTLKEAEIMFNRQFYERSLSAYNHALNIEPENRIAIQKKNEVEREMANLSTNLMYEKLIASANKLYKKEKYEAAMKEYFAATEIKPNDKYASIRLNAIEQKIRLNEDFVEYITDAESQFEKGELKDSKENYLHALKIKSDDEYVRAKLKEINKLILLNDKSINKYQLAIERADRLYSQQLYEKARMAYIEAGTIKPDEDYPLTMKNKIDDIEKGKSDAFASAELMSSTSNEIKTTSDIIEQPGTHINSNKSVDDSFSNVDKNNNINPEKISSKVDMALVDVSDEVELVNIYSQYIKQAEYYYNNEKYIESRSLYYKAWDVKPTEKHAKQQINNINQILRDSGKTQNDKDYLQFVNLADSTFRNNQYAVARGWYNRALGIKANEQYPKEQIKEIENRITERLAGRSGQQFDENMQKAHSAFKSNSYSVARFWYKKALELRPNNIEVKNKLVEIDELLSRGNTNNN